MAIFESQLSTDHIYSSPSLCLTKHLSIDKIPIPNRKICKKKIPEKVLIDGATFCESHPYHVLFDKNMVIKHCGAKLQEMCPSINEDGAKISDFVILRHPVIPLSVENIRLFIHNIFMAEVIRETMTTFYQDKPPLLVRG